MTFVSGELGAHSRSEDEDGIITTNTIVGAKWTFAGHYSFPSVLNSRSVDNMHSDGLTTSLDQEHKVIAAFDLRLESSPLAICDLLERR
jgi:hypothetical protein